MIKNLDKVKAMGKEFSLLLRNKDFGSYGKLLHEHWLLKKERSEAMSNNKIDDLYEFGLNNGSNGGKIIGAGGGGFFLFYVNLSKQKYFIKHLSKLISVPFKFSYEGSKIMFKNLRN